MAAADRADGDDPGRRPTAQVTAVGVIPRIRSQPGRDVRPDRPPTARRARKEASVRHAVLVIVTDPPPVRLTEDVRTLSVMGGRCG